MKKQDLYAMYNATSTADPPGSDNLERYESWLERQLISRLTRIKVGDIVSEIENHTDLLDRTDCIHVVTYVRPFDHGEYFEIGLSGYDGGDEKFSEFEVYPIPGSAIVAWLEKVGSFVGVPQQRQRESDAPVGSRENPIVSNLDGLIKGQYGSWNNVLSYLHLKGIEDGVEVTEVIKNDDDEWVEYRYTKSDVIEKCKDEWWALRPTKVIADHLFQAFHAYHPVLKGQMEIFGQWVFQVRKNSKL